jgi:elongation factor Ts
MKRMKSMNENPGKKNISMDLIKALREKSSASIMDCKRALEEAEGDFEKAINILKQKGINIAQKKASRVTKEGAIGSYIHTGSKLGVMVEVNCETDFVARNEQFKELINEIAMQIAASDPKYIDASMIPPELIESVKQSFLREIEESCKNVEDKEKLLEEKLKMYLSEVSLYDQPFIKDPSITIRELIQSAIAKFGENITVSRFVRYKLGELK